MSVRKHNVKIKYIYNPITSDSTNHYFYFCCFNPLLPMFCTVLFLTIHGVFLYFLTLFCKHIPMFSHGIILNV